MIINWVWGKFKISALQQTETKSSTLPAKKPLNTYRKAQSFVPWRLMRATDENYRQAVEVLSNLQKESKRKGVK